MSRRVWTRPMLFFWIRPVLFSLAFLWLASACASRALPLPTALPEPALAPTLTAEPLAPTPLPSTTPASLPVPSPTPEPHPDDLPDYYGGLVVTMDFVGQSLAMKPGQGFLLRLSDEFLWTVQVSPGDLLTKNQRFTPEVNEQGVYIAREKGTAVLSAVGEPVCSQENPPCSWPSVLFQFTVNIQ